MKRYVSRALKGIAAFYLTFPLSYLILVALIFDIPGKQCVRIILSPLYWLITALAIATGYGLWEVKRWSWYVFVTTNILLAYHNALLMAEYAQTNHKAVAFGISLAGILFGIFWVGREIKVPYFLPRIRWWESDPRYRLSVPVSVRRTSGEPMEGEILDMSMGGCFVKLRTDLLQDETVTMQFKIFGQPLDCAGTVVWRTQSAVTHPKGVGVKFAPMPKPQRRMLKLVNARLKEISNLYKTSRYLISQEEFFKRMEALQSQQLLPRAKAGGEEA